MTAKNNSDFFYRHVGLDDFDIKKMLNRLNIKSLDELIAKVIPKNILSPITENLLKKDLSEIEEKEILDNIEIHFVENANEILKKAFISKIHPYKENANEKIDIPRKPITGGKSPLPH